MHTVYFSKAATGITLAGLKQETVKATLLFLQCRS